MLVTTGFFKNQKIIEVGKKTLTLLMETNSISLSKKYFRCIGLNTPPPPRHKAEHLLKWIVNTHSRNVKLFKEPKNRFQRINSTSLCSMSPYLQTFQGAQESIPSLAKQIPQNRILGFINVYKYYFYSVPCPHRLFKNPALRKQKRVLSHRLT